jgi:CCR4-NOT transcriptional regulation complex NOT5 subunit
MTIFDKTVKLRDINPRTYTPKRGIDVTWGYDNNDIYGTFTAGNINNESNLTEMHDINRELSKLKVIQDSIKTYKTYNKVRPKSPLRITHHDDGNKLVEDKA